MRVLFSFLFLFLSIIGFSQQRNGIVEKYLQQKYGSNKEALSEASSYKISSSYTDDFTKITYVYLQQMYNGVPIYNAINTIAIKDNKVVLENSRFVENVRKKVNVSKANLKPTDAITNVLKHLEINSNENIRIKSSDKENNIYIYKPTSFSSSEIKVQLCYTYIADILKLSWDVSFEMKQASHWWNTRIDAVSGAYLEKNDYVAHCEFENENEKEGENELPPPPPPASIQGYNVLHFPIESPNFGTRALLNTIYDSTASPFDWLDTNGVTGDEFVITRGNNVYAYEDANNDNAPGYSPTANANGFDYPFTNYAVPITNQDAAIANLFYANNKVHDLTYLGGFTEQAGNFQYNNYGKGGLGNDAVMAEGFDGGGTNNANFATPADGANPRMQMYLWSGNSSTCSNLTTSSSPFTYSIGTAAFAVNASATDTIVLAIDATAPVNDGCSAMSNVAGKIALIDRGTCAFSAKALNAQASGAVGVIIVNNVAGAAPAMGGAAAGLTIPIVSVSQTDGNTIKAALLSGTVTGTINTCIANEIDANFDNGVIAHEYGHGVSNRLTGGPAAAGCLTNAEQGGEGWSDWLALITTMKASDSANQARGIGTYVNAQSSTGGGIRRYPYSYNMSINPQTFADLGTSTTVHQRGEIWCDAIWDMTWLITNSLGFSSNPNNTNAGNNIAMRLVLEGMKLQPCNPGFIDARNAILTADALVYGNAHRCLIWEAFARRGMGFGASQGSSNAVGDETVSFAMPYYCLPPTAAPTADFNATTTTVACGTTVNFNDLSVQAYDWKWDFGDGDTSILQNPTHVYTSSGLYNVKLTVTNPMGVDSEIKSTYINVTPNFSAIVNVISDTICKGDTATIIALPTGSNNVIYELSSIPFAPLSTTGTVVALTDDSYSNLLPIGFSFNFYGNNYTDFRICSNGFITFTSGQSPFPSYGPSLPTNSNPSNLIAFAWNDWNPQNAGSSITYSTMGVAPNRKLVVSFNSSHYGGTGYLITSQLILNETSNIIEVHTTTHSDISPYDNSATTTVGVQNILGTKATAVAGMNGNLVATYNNLSHRFTPAVVYNYNWLPSGANNDTLVTVPALNGSFNVLINDGGVCTESFSSPNIHLREPSLNLNYNAPLFTLDTLQILISSGDSIVGYNTTGPNTFSSTQQNIVIPNITNSQNAGTYTVTIQDTMNCVKTDTINVLITPAPILSPKVYLAGAYDSANQLMTDLLRTQSLIPLSEPYSLPTYSSTFIHVNGGGETTSNTVLSTTGNNAIVDWVFVQLRNKLDSSIVLATQSALVQRDGNIVSARDGVSPLVFKTLGLDNYFVSIKHRNHLGVMTASAISLNENSNLLDFTSPSTITYLRQAPINNPAPFSGAQKAIGTIRAMYAGNANILISNNANRFIRYNGIANDRIAILNVSGLTGTIIGYYAQDINMDGRVKFNGLANDRLYLLQVLQGGINSVLNEQTPN